MTLDKILVTITGIIGMIGVYWFFLAKNEKEVTVNDSIDIIVDGGYTPQTISIPRGKLTELNFVRRDPNSCLEEVVLGDFHIRKFLPLNQKVTIKLSPQTLGTFTYSCGMNMFHGKILVHK